jgi:hypothetical protein
MKFWRVTGNEFWENRILGKENFLLVLCLACLAMMSKKLFAQFAISPITASRYRNFVRSIFWAALYSVAQSYID